MDYCGFFLHDLDMNSGSLAITLEHENRTYEARVIMANTFDMQVPVFRKPHRHAVYHIHLYQWGMNRFWLDRGLVPCQEGTLAVVSPGTWHEFNPYDPGRICFCQVKFQFLCDSHALTLPFSAVMGKMLGRHFPEPSFPMQLGTSTARVLDHAIAKVIQAMRQPGILGRFTANLRLADVFLHLASIYSGQGDAGTAQEDGLERARSAIETRYHEKLRLADLARVAGWSAGHFNRLFVLRFGKSPIDYLLDVRLQTARQLLLGPKLRCREVGVCVGIEDEYYFSRLFKSRFGISPLEYRRQNRVLTESPK